MKNLREVACAFVVGIALAMATLSCSGCPTGSAADARVRSALDMVAVVVDPAYSFAVDACATRQNQIAEEVEAGRMTKAQSAVALEPVRARCKQTREAFDVIRSAHMEAVQLVEAGEVAKAEALVAEIRAQLSGLRARPDPCALEDGSVGSLCEGGVL